MCSDVVFRTIATRNVLLGWRGLQQPGTIIDGGTEIVIICEP
jgi:hypothetical protein